MVFISFPSIEEAQRLQRVLAVPLAVFVHSSTDGSTEEALRVSKHLEELDSNDFCFSSIKGRVAQEKAFKAVLSVGHFDSLTLIHAVQEGTKEYGQLVQALPQYQTVPRVHLFPSPSAIGPPIVLHNNHFTCQNLLRCLQHFLRLPLGGVPPLQPIADHASTARQAKSILSELLQQVEGIDEDLKRKQTSSTIFSSPPPPRTSPAVTNLSPPVATAPPSLPSVGDGPSSVSKTNLGVSARRIHTKTSPTATTATNIAVIPPSASNTTASSFTDPDTDSNKTKRPSPSPLSKEVPSPPSQRKRPEFIHLRCIVPSGKILTVEHLSPSSSTIFSHVRPVVREHLECDDFSFVVTRAGVQRPQRLTREEEESTLESISITSPSTLRVVLSSNPSKAPEGGLAQKVDSFFRSSKSSSSEVSLWKKLFSGGSSESQRSQVEGHEEPSASTESRGASGVYQGDSKIQASSVSSPSLISSAKNTSAIHDYNPRSNIRSLSDVLSVSQHEDSSENAAFHFGSTGDGRVKKGDNLSMSSLIRHFKGGKKNLQTMAPGERPPEEFLNLLQQIRHRQRNNGIPNINSEDNDSEEVVDEESSDEASRAHDSYSSGSTKSVPFSGKGRRLRDSDGDPSTEPTK